MRAILRHFLEPLARLQRVEFDYRDTAGMHHGRCYVRYLFGGREQIRRTMTGLGYTNIRLD